MTQQCPYCQRVNADQARFCKGCGAELKRECPRCHHLNPNDAHRCEVCRARLPRGRSILDRLNPDVAQGLVAVGRGLGWTLIVLAFVVFFWTPPPRLWDDALLLGAGGSLLILAEALKPYARPDLPGGIEIIPPDRPK